MAQLEFEFTYDGPGLADGEMPVNDLAPALLALGELFVAASAEIYPDRPPIAVNLRATDEGSFTLRLALESKDVWDTFVDIAGSQGAGALANLFQIVGGTYGLFGYIKLRSRIKSIEQGPPTSGAVKVILDDGETVEFPPAVLELNKRIEIRRKAREVVAPLRREGIVEARFRYTETTTVVVRKEDVPAYEVEEPDPDTLLDVEEERFVEIISPHFQEGKKWRVRLSENLAISATIEDPEFLGRIDAGEPFRKGDFLRSRIHVVQTRRQGGGLHTEYTITKVLDHFGAQDNDQLALGGAA